MSETILKDVPLPRGRYLDDWFRFLVRENQTRQLPVSTAEEAAR